jgi:hypothetical protein
MMIINYATNYFKCQELVGFVITLRIADGKKRHNPRGREAPRPCNLGQHDVYLFADHLVEVECLRLIVCERAMQRRFDQRLEPSTENRRRHQPQSWPLPVDGLGHVETDPHEIFASRESARDPRFDIRNDGAIHAVREFGVGTPTNDCGHVDARQVVAGSMLLEPRPAAVHQTK